jgi:hypothetical protein
MGNEYLLLKKNNTGSEQDNQCPASPKNKAGSKQTSHDQSKSYGDDKKMMMTTVMCKSLHKNMITDESRLL